VDSHRRRPENSPIQFHSRWEREASRGPHRLWRIWINPPKPFSNSRIIPTAPATASAHRERVIADVKCGGANRPKLTNSMVNQKLRQGMLLEYPGQSAGSLANAYRQFWRQGSEPVQATTSRAEFPVSRQATNPRLSEEVRAGLRGNRSSVFRSAYLRRVSRAGSAVCPYRRKIWSRRSICADRGGNFASQRAKQGVGVRDQQSKHQSRDRGNYSHGYRDKIFRLVCQMVRRQPSSDSAARERAC
jgi:hypothetical protein